MPISTSSPTNDLEKSTATPVSKVESIQDSSEGNQRKLDILTTGVNPTGSVDEKTQTTRPEIWSYYLYYVGNNGLALFNYGPAQAQNLLSQAADPTTGNLHFLGRDRSINSVVLLSNGISFAIQVVVFLIIGSYADFGRWRPTILIACSCVAYGIGFGWLAVHDASQWREGMGLYIVGLIAYQTCLTFWTAAFPGLARDTKEMREKAAELSNGEMEPEQYYFHESVMRSKLSNLAFYVQSCGEMIILAVIVGIMFGLHVDDGDAENTWGLSVIIAFAAGVWLLVSLPWFFLERRRPGIDPEMNIVLAGILQLYRAITKIWRLRQSLFYLIGKENFSKDPGCADWTRVFPFGRFSKYNSHCDFNAYEVS